MAEMTEMYTHFAKWWPCISPVEDYEEEAAFIAELFKSHTRPIQTVLGLGSGGGHNAAHLKAHFEMTLTDLSSAMLRVSKHLNPTCRHICGDMRTLRLNTQFDAVFLHDAVEYMTTPDDLTAALHTAALHCKPGGLVLAFPDVVEESFEPSTTSGGTDRKGSLFGARYLEWSIRDPNHPQRVQTEYALLCRDEDGTVHRSVETHTTGLFSQEVWLDLMRTQEIPAQLLWEPTEDHTPRPVFLGTSTHKHPPKLCLNLSPSPTS